MNGGMYNGTRIIAEETLEEMHLNQPPHEGYGLAWYNSGQIYGRIYSRIFSGHEGDLPGYHNSMFMQHPDFEHGVIFFITGDRFTPLCRTVALWVRNILFIKANLLTHSDIIEIENIEK